MVRRTLRQPRLITRLGLSLCLIAAAEVLAASQPPNLLLIMADDLGYSDLGCYGSEIETPHLDRLANNGIRLTQFYNTGRCWPTRASLLTGYYPHSVRRDRVPNIKSGGSGVRPEWAPLICDPLRNAGYRTYHTGKWHIDGMPIQSGFDLSYYVKDQNRFFNPTKHYQDDQPLDPVPKESGYYATTALGDHAVECLQQHAEHHPDRPFFQYLAFTAPHFPLHALQPDIDKYRQTYVAGWDKIRAKRWQRIQSLGLVDAKLSAVQTNVGPPYRRPDDIELLGEGEVDLPQSWDSLSDQQQQFQATKMAIHAAMIDCMDQQIGRVLDQLRLMDQLDHTVVMFLSDNGGSAEIMVRGDGHDPEAPMGSWATHLCLGPGWSTVSNTPFRYHKTWTHEGGTATPLIVHWPNGVKAAGELRRQPGHVIDIWPTLLELAGVELDRSTSPERPGRSLVDAWTVGSERSRRLWWSHEGNRAFRAGDWKISAVRDQPWELYDLSKDRAETVDLANEYPNKLQALKEQWESENARHVERAKSPKG